MSRARWVVGLVLGVSGCSGSYIGGDATPPSNAGGSGTTAGVAGSAAEGGALAGTGGLGAGGDGIGGSGNSGAVGNNGAIDPGHCDSQIDAWLAFDSDAADFNRDLYLIRPDGSQLTRLTDHDAIDEEPYISPDGSQLSFTSDRDGSPQIYVMKLSDRSVEQVTHRPGGASQSSFSADGQLIAFNSGASVYTVKPDGSDETQIASGLDSFNAYFSPRFLGEDELVFDRRNEIKAVKLDGSGQRYIVDNWTTTIESPSVSPSSNEIAYATHCGVGTEIQGFSIWTTPANTNTPPCEGRRVTPISDSLNSNRPAWGPANTIAYQRINSANISGIALIDRAAGSSPCMLTSPNDDSRNPSWSPIGLEL